MSILKNRENEPVAAISTIEVGPPSSDPPKYSSGWALSNGIIFAAKFWKKLLGTPHPPPVSTDNPNFWHRQSTQHMMVIKMWGRTPILGALFQKLQIWVSIFRKIPRHLEKFRPKNRNSTRGSKLSNFRSWFRICGQNRSNQLFWPILTPKTMFLRPKLLGFWTFRSNWSISTSDSDSASKIEQFWCNLDPRVKFWFLTKTPLFLTFPTELTNFDLRFRLSEDNFNFAAPSHLFTPPPVP